MRVLLILTATVVSARNVRYTDDTREGYLPLPLFEPRSRPRLQYRPQRRDLQYRAEENLNPVLERADQGYKYPMPEAPLTNSEHNKFHFHKNINEHGPDFEVKGSQTYDFENFNSESGYHYDSRDPRNRDPSQPADDRNYKVHYEFSTINGFKEEYHDEFSTKSEKSYFYPPSMHAPIARQDLEVRSGSVRRENIVVPDIKIENNTAVNLTVINTNETENHTKSGEASTTKTTVTIETSTTSKTPTTKVNVPDKVKTNGTESDKMNRDDKKDDRWVWSDGDEVNPTTTAATDAVTLDDRAAFSGDKCATGMVRFNGVCVPTD